MKSHICIFVLLTAATVSVAQEDTKKLGAGNFSRLRVDMARNAQFNIETGELKSVTGGFDITVLTDKPGEGEVRLHGGSMESSGKAEAGSSPAKIVLRDNVVIDHPKASISADKAEWDFNTNVLVFTGNPVINSEQVKGMRASRVVVNLDTGLFETTDMQAQELFLQRDDPGGPGTTGTAVLASSDIADWPGLLTKIKAQGQSDAPSPGRQILELLDKQSKEFFLALATDTEPGDKLKAQLVGRFNSVLNSPRFYSAEAWKGVTLSDSLRETAAKDISSLPKAELLHFNRGLLEAAYPDEITKKG